MGRDMAKKAVVDKASRKKVYFDKSIKIRRDSGIIEALDTMMDNSGISSSKYIVQALTEKLIRDGYLQEQQPEEN